MTGVRHVSYLPLFLATLLAVVSIVGAVIAALLINRAEAPKAYGADARVPREQGFCEARGATCGPKRGSLWGYCHGLAPAACGASTLCGLAQNGDCIITSPHATGAFGACAAADPADCGAARFPACCQCDCSDCADPSGCATRALAAACTRAATPARCAAAGAACRWFC